MCPSLTWEQFHKHKRFKVNLIRLEISQKRSLKVDYADENKEITCNQCKNKENSIMSDFVENYIDTMEDLTGRM